MIEKLITDSVMLWATIDPIGTLVLFAAITSGLPHHERKKIAFKATCYSAAILLGSIILGQIILAALGIKLISLQIAGGIILFLFGLQMIFGSTFKEMSHRPEAGHDLAVFPMAVPAIASPGAIMAVILLTDNYQYSILSQAMTSAVMFLILGLTYVLMLWSTPILKVIGTTGAAVLIRVMGMILAALSVELIMNGLGVQRWIVPSP